MRKKRNKTVRVMAAAMSAVFVLTSVPAGMLSNVHAADAQALNTSEESSVLPYLDVTLSFEERAADLVSRMTLEEKQSQLQARTAAAIPRLGIRQYDWWSEALHGVARSGEATSFPTGLGIASTWDTELVKEMMVITSDEARAYTNTYGKGLSYWSPTVNLARDPRWGRAEETYGEDPYLTAQIGASFVEGLQGDDETYLKAIATIKHFAANNSEYNRHNGSSDMDERTLREYYTKPYKDIVQQADVQSVMTSYNKLNGTPMPANTYMLDTLLRRTWGFDGYVTSDCGAIRDIYSSHQWVPEGWDHAVNATEATALAIKAGNDLNCGSVYASEAVNAVNQGLLSEDDIDVALVRLFTARMKTGEFDPQEKVSYASEEYSWANQISAEDHTQKAEQSSDEAVVLLKNEPVKDGGSDILPLDKETVENVVIVGDLADEVILGDYSGSPKAENKSTPVQGLQTLLGSDKVTYIEGGVADIYGTYNFNIKNLKLLDGNGDVLRTLAPSENNGLSNCRIEASDTLGYIKAGGYIYYENLNMDNVKRISADVAYPSSEGRGGSIEVRLDSPDGTLLGTIKTNQTGDWQVYQTFETAYSQGGFDGARNLYFVFKDPAINADLSTDEIETIKNADAVIAYVGTRESDSAEEMDRATLDLPRNQADLVSTIAAINPNTIVYIQSVGEVNVESFKNDVPAILWCTYNGQAQGNAMARILFGEVNPSGKLPFTWYRSEKDLADIGNYAIRPDNTQDGRTYQYYQKEVSYPFGHGLSYTNFKYSNLKVSKNSVTPNDVFTVSVDVENTGDMAGKEVVELYIASPDADGQVRPVKELKGFDKVELAVGEKKTVSMEVDASGLYYWDEDKMEETFDQGTYRVLVGTSSENICQEGSFSLSGTLNKTLQTVTAIPDKTSLDAAEPDNKVTTKLSAAMNDQSFCNLDEATVTYSSSNEDVAAVDRNGIVTPVGAGTALITASVTVDGVTKTDSYPVAVHQEILDVVDQEDTDFTTMDSVEDLSAAGWEIIRPDDSNPVKIENGNGLVIKSGRGDLYQNQNTAGNLVAKTLEGDWTATIHMTADIIPTQRYQQAGVLIYGDDDNFIKLADIFDGKTSAQVQFGQEEDGTWTQIIEPFVSSQEYYFRIEKIGTQYKAFYSTDGESFQLLGTAIQQFTNPKLALFAFNGEQAADTMTAAFKDVVFEKLEVNCTCGLYDLEFANETEIPYDEGIKGVELQTNLKTRRGCQIKGHLDNEIEYQYVISDTGENTANAVIEGNVLKAANAGKVTVKVTAVWNEAEETIEKEFTVLENDPEDLKPLVHMMFDEGEGTSVTDVDEAYTGTITGTVTWVDGKYGKALSFDEGYVDLGIDSFDGDWTIGMWVKREDNDRTNTALISGDEGELKLEQWKNTRKIGISKYGVDDWTYDYSAPAGEWVHLAFVASEGKTVLYANGEKQAEMAQTISVPTLFLGANSKTDLADRGYMKGAIDDLKIYKGALTEEQIKGMMEETVAAPIDTTALQSAVDEANEKQESEYMSDSWKEFAAVCEEAEAMLNQPGASQKEIDEMTAKLRKAMEDLKPLVVFVHMMFDEGEGTSVTDVDEAYTGTITGTVTWVDGKYGKALSFDEGYVDLGIDSFDGDWTIGMWVKREDNDRTNTALISGDEGELKLEQWKNTRKIGISKYGVDDWTYDYSAPAGEWVHLAFVASGGKTVLYANGEKQAEMAQTISVPTLFLGANSKTDLADRGYMKGAIDDLKIYKGALTEEQIKGMMEETGTAPIPVDKSGLQSAVDKVKDYQEADYTSESWTAFAKALADAQDVLVDNDATEDEVAAAKTALESAADALKYKDADYTRVDAAIADANELNKANYKDFSAVEAAIKAVVRGKNITEQDAVDKMAKAINDAVAALEYKDADYSKVDAAITAANALDKASYKDFSAVEAAVKAVVRGKNITEQDAVDKMAKAINDAVAALKYKDADYSKVDAAITAADALDKASYKDFSAVEVAVNAVVRGKNITEQDAVDKMAKDINDAVAALEYKDADYSKVDAAITAANALNKENYKDFSAVEAAIKAVVRGKNITEQDAVDAMAKAINDAVSALELKDADYTAVDEAIAKANALKKDNYKEFSAVEAAIKAVVRGKNITEQADVDAMAKAINDAVSALELKAADYTAVDEAIAKANELNKDDYKDFSAVEAAIKAVVRDKDITEQDAVDAMAKAIEAAIAGLEKKEPPLPQELPYKDVSEGDWFYDYVYDVYVKELMTGLEKTIFAPNNNIVRAQFAVILYRMEGQPEVTFKDTFPDVKDGNFYSDAVIWAADNGIVTGYTGTGLFGPNDPITREQMAAMMFRYANYKEMDTSEREDLSAFPDGKNVQEFATDAVKWCVAEGIISGKGEEPKVLDPQGNTVRAECATIISRYTEAEK